MISQAGGCNGSRAVRRIFLKLCLSGLAAHITFTQTVEGFGL